MSSHSAVKTSFILTQFIIVFLVSFFMLAPFIKAASYFMPGMVGTYVGVVGSGLVFVGGLIMRSCLGLLSFKILEYHIPSFFAVASWASPHGILRVVVPALCMVAFTVFYAAPYTEYWLIPVALLYSKSKNIL